MSRSRSKEQGTHSAQNLRMPPLPKVLPKVLGHLHASRFADKEAVLAAMQCDPSLEDRILKRVNSQMRRSVDDIERAIELIGSTTTAGIVIGLSMNKLNKLQRGPASACIRQLVQHSEGTAILARHLLDRQPDESSEQSNDSAEESLAQSVFAKGFVHDLGKLVLIYNYPEKAAALYGDDWYGQGPEDVGERAVERRTFGCDHTEAGAYAADEMDLPSALTAAVKHHHDPSALPADTFNTWHLRAVRAANIATKAMGTNFSGLYALKVSLDWETCAEHPVWLHWQTKSSERRPKALVQRDFILYSKFFLDLPDVRGLSL